MNVCALACAAKVRFRCRMGLEVLPPMVIIGGAVAAMGALPYGLGWVFGQNKVRSIDFSDSCCTFNEREFCGRISVVGMQNDRMGADSWDARLKDHQENVLPAVRAKFGVQA